MNLPISLYVALRYWRAKSADRFGRLVANLASFGIVLGVMALIIVLSVMNGLEGYQKQQVLSSIPHAIISQDAPISAEKTLENTPNLTIKQGEVTKLLVEDGKITGVKTYSGATYNCKAVVLCTGTYLKARCIYGDVSNYTGPNGLQAANYLTDSLKELGIEMFRFKTGTPARIDKRSVG